MNKPNVVLDFTLNKSMETLVANQEVALIPAAMAKKLLKMYAGQLFGAPAGTIILKHVADLKQCAEDNNLEAALGVSISWLLERELIENVSKENWDAYACSSEEPIEEVVIRSAAIL